MNENMKSGCENFEEMIDLKVAGWLSKEEIFELDSHLESCDACKEQARRAQGIALLIAQKSTPVAPVINVQSLEKLTIKENIVTHAWWGRALWPVGIAAGVALTCYTLFQSPESPQMPQLGVGKSTAVELASASPSLMTYNRALAEGGDVMEQVLIAHDRRIHLYEPSSARLAFSSVQ
jgi:negative regulator of sigma E activity